MFPKLKIAAALMAFIALSLFAAGCGASGNSTTGLEKIKATWITADLSFTTISVPVQTVEQDKIVHFWMDTPAGRIPFMAIALNGKNYVRADICVPCRSYNFSLENDVLVCDTCGSRFSAVTGDGISGACKDYPKAAVAFTVQDAKLVMSVTDAQTAYSDTLKPGLP